jgi:hypothetical protein
MKTSRILTVLLGMIALSVGLSAKDFVGKIRFKTTEEDQTTFMNYFVKEGLVRVEIEGGPKGTFIAIVNLPKREMIMLMVDKKMYMVNKLPEPKKPEQTTPAQSEYVRTGETEKILGYRCEKILIKGKDSTTEYWGTGGLGTFMTVGNRGTRGGAATQSAGDAILAELGLFPLRTVQLNKAGKETKRTEAELIEAHSLPDSTFAPPDDFKKFEMPSLRGLNPFGKKDN